ncbi:SLC35A4 upstream open reading frame protein-like [Pogoniulus pusillus]|uniref:SLC35A4 upstream open reading frame protein-like n=1 Tax=Pogoniulus pusillus TaxID=488313 RepID=UPI0030B98D84
MGPKKDTAPLCSSGHWHPGTALPLPLPLPLPGHGCAPAPGLTRVPPQDSLPKLQDVAFLKQQLQSLQRRVEAEVQAGVGQDGSLLASPFLKGFLAGYLIAKLRFSAVLGFVAGTCTGIYAAQSYAVPNVEQTVRDYISSLGRGRD